MFSYVLRSFLQGLPRRQKSNSKRDIRTQASSASASASASSAWQPWASAALTCGGMSAGGDVAAQSLVRWQLRRENKRPPAFEATRTARMFAFGLLWYGPFQHWWYGALARKFPGTALSSFLPKVTLNQVVLGPIVLSTAFAWNFACTQRLGELQGKLERDFVPTLMNGWKFWVPAACANFWIVPLRFQVLFMSTCGFVWTAYLSFASYNSANAITVPRE